MVAISSVVILLSLVSTNAKHKADPPDYAHGDWHIETRIAHKIKAQLTEDLHVPSLNPTQWLIVRAYPPTMLNQTVTGFDFVAKTKSDDLGYKAVQEDGPLRRYTAQIVMAPSESLVSDGFSTQATFTLQLSSRHLVPGKPRQGSFLPKLTKYEEKEYLSENTHIQWKSGPLRDWINYEKLTRAPDESTIGFAWRTAQALHRDYRYGGVFWDVKDVCKGRSADCAGLSSVIVGVLRANGIPARLNLGFWSTDASANPPPFHVRLEFYSPEAGGWVPLDGSGLTQWGNNWAYAFGNDDGTFVTEMIETDLPVDTVVFGVQNVTQFQTLSYWATGQGDFSRAMSERRLTVKEIP